MTEHPYHSRGAQSDRARTWSYLERIAKALERIAAALEDEDADDAG
jgi:hypothetical protein